MLPCAKIHKKGSSNLHIHKNVFIICILTLFRPATAALTKLKPIWRDNNIPLGSKVKLMRSLVISIFLYACDSWTLTAELEKRTQAFEISYKDHLTNE